MLEAFADAEALLAWLHARDGDPEAKNRYLRALLDEVGSPEGEAATTLLLVALWPGLDAIRGRLLRFVRHDIAWLDAELIGRLTLGLGRTETSCLTRVAATLLRNVERDLRRALMAEPQGDTIDADLAAAPEPDDSDRIAAGICRALGRDGPLVVAVALRGYSQAEAGAQLGLSHAQARKRYQRAMARIARMALSHADAPHGFPPLTALPPPDRG